MSKTNNSRGIMMFAHNNVEIDYIALAYVNALLIQKNLGLTNDQITVVTDSYSLDHAKETIGIKKLRKAFKNIILSEKDQKFKYANIRVYKDTSHTVKELQFYNVNRCDAYDLSPYEETIVIDADYLVLSNKLNECWGHNNELMMNWEWQDLMSERQFDGLDRVSPTGITMYWATVVYFRKSDYAETFFEFVKHVKDNREYYKELYKWPGKLYRNDYSFSIAAHMISGFQDKGVTQLPFKLYKTFDTDNISQALGMNDFLLALEKPRSPGDFILTRWKNIDLHIMNKWAINRVKDEVLKYVTATATTKARNAGTKRAKETASAGSA